MPQDPADPNGVFRSHERRRSTSRRGWTTWKYGRFRAFTRFRQPRGRAIRMSRRWRGSLSPAWNSSRRREPRFNSLMSHSPADEKEVSEGTCDWLFLICRFRYRGSFAVAAEQLLEFCWYSWGPRHYTDSKRTL